MNAASHRNGASTVTVVIVGAGQSGLAMSRCLARASIDHVLLERGEVANSWRHERWDSLRLLTPNWQSRLPDFVYSGDTPDGFMTMDEVVGFVRDYAAFIDAPVHSGVTVSGVSATEGGYLVTTDQGVWRSRCVVVASGAFNLPVVPGVAEGLPADVQQFSAHDYRRPEQLPEGGVLVVGASATGLQLADEIHASGREVTIAVGEHVRMPRIYRERDIQWWMDAAGVLDERYDEVDDIRRARGVPSPQLVGSDDHATLDLNALTDRGVKLVGRLVGVAGGKAQFSGSLKNNCALADLKMGRLLNTIDEWAEQAGMGNGDQERPEPTRVEAAPPLLVDLQSGAIRSVVWATGFKPDHSWLNVDVFDRKGRIRHDGGVVDAAGMYLLGHTFLRRRKSSFMHGAEDDATDLAAHLVGYLGGTSTAVAARRATTLPRG